ncbi:pyridoxamine 5'-phosphate oxidase family protein [Phenylobacterium immobile]|uniref:pyridoxamine 5'-phosphate oxidase family protein n=1 Tax=Phenylobacterium immobile TaxID=21 RepID=UPI00114632A8|nr:pyridoxamine 5'-phosphate oxidase family protein [Phenylobacterium immobile]
MNETDPKSEILALLDENRVMSLATLRPDGWPQNTMVGYVNDDLAIYFAVARSSQKFSNLSHDARASIAIGRDAPNQIRGLSMAVRIAEVTSFEEIQRLNQRLHARYPEQAVFAPREASAVILKATPALISIIDLSKGPGSPRLVSVQTDVTVRPVV